MKHGLRGLGGTNVDRILVDWQDVEIRERARMAINLLAELYDSEGNKLGESFFGSFLSVKKWAKEQNATFIRLTDTVEGSESYYLKSGAQGRWSEAPRETFEFVINRKNDKVQAERERNQ